MVISTSNAQTANQLDTWITDCGNDGCVTYFMTAGLQIFIGQEAGGDRLLADFRVLPNSIPGTPVGIRLDNDWIGGMVVNECNDTYCGFILDLSADSSLLDEFKAAGSGMIAYVVASGEQIVMVPFHLNGFTAANNER